MYFQLLRVLQLPNRNHGTRLAQTPSHHPIELMLPQHQGEWLPQQRRENKINISLPPSHFFSPLAIETMGVLGPKSMVLVRDLGRRSGWRQGNLVQLTISCSISRLRFSEGTPYQYTEA